jgi:hypothetical protein
VVLLSPQSQDRLPLCERPGIAGEHAAYVTADLRWFQFQQPHLIRLTYRGTGLGQLGVAGLTTGDNDLAEAPSVEVLAVKPRNRGGSPGRSAALPVHLVEAV